MLVLTLISVLTGLLWASKSFHKTVKWIANRGETIPFKKHPKAKSNNKPEFVLNNILHQTLTKTPKTQYILIREHPRL